MASKVEDLVNENGLCVQKKYGLTYEEFAKDHMFGNFPVVIGDACKDWTAKDKFTPDFFRTEYGDHEVVVQGNSYSLNDFIDLLEKSTTENPAPYPCKLQIDREYPKLIPDISPRLQYATPDWCHHKLVKPFLGSADTYEVFLGSPGGQFPYVHYDFMGLHAYITQLYGYKEFTVVPPDQTPYIYPKKNDPWVSEVPDIKNIDLKKFPLSAKATPITFTVGPGETLFIPNGWWHTARSLTVTISVALDALNASNWNRFEKEVLMRVNKKTNVVVGKMVSLYLSMVGKFLSGTTKTQ